MMRRFLLLVLLAACGDDEPIPAVDASMGVLDSSALEVEDAGASDSDAPRDADAPFVCDVVAPTSCPDPAPKFADVQPIFTRQCGVCHGQDWTGEWPLDNYSHISDWQDSIRDELVRCSMPPRDGGVVISLENRMKILSWIRCGLPK
jgi:cytochrome c5